MQINGWEKYLNICTDRVFILPLVYVVHPLVRSDIKRDSIRGFKQQSRITKKETGSAIDYFILS